MKKAKEKPKIKTRAKTKVIAFRVSETNFDLIKENLKSSFSKTVLSYLLIMIKKRKFLV